MKKSNFLFKSKFSLVLINLLIIALATVVLYIYQINVLKKEFNHNIENIIKKEFSNNISSTKGVLTSLSSVYKSIHKMNQSEFTVISKDLLSSYDYMKSIAFATIVNKDDKKEFLEEIKDLGFFNFEIKTFDDKKLVDQKEIYKKFAPIIYIEPANYKYASFYGFDVYNNKDKYLENAFLNAAKEDKIVIVDRLLTPLGFNLNLFIKATYKGENEKNNDQYRLENTNGFFVIDVDIEKLLTNIKSKFKEYEVKIESDETFIKFIEENPFKSIDYLSNSLVYFKKTDELNNHYLFVKKEIMFKDFNFTSFILILSLIFIIQILYTRSWYKDIEVKEELTYKATHDDLTGLANRNYFHKEFHRLAVENNESEKKLALLFIDLDRFKEINDSLGHKFGDEVLIEISKRFKKAMRSSDLICRHGGDEFLILIDGFTEISYIENIVKKVMDSMIEPIVFDKQKIYITLSIGIALYPNDAKTVDELLRNADSAMYKAKDEGRNTFSFYSVDMTTRVKEKLILENKIRDAIKNDEFIVYFQPQFNAMSNELVGMEALVRWQSENEIIPPFKFIPVAEDTGLIVELDRLVMRKAITQFSNWLEEGYNISSLSLNLSMKQLKSKDFTKLLKKTVLESNCNPSDIELEITEGEIMENPTSAIEKLKELSNFGIRLSVDDFGTGYSSLAYLKKLPIDKLKIDRAFVKDLPIDDDDIAITKSIIALAKSLKLDLIAEGVENKDQVDFLLANGCNKIQGYYYGKPLSSEEFKSILKRNN